MQLIKLFLLLIIFFFITSGCDGSKKSTQIEDNKFEKLYLSSGTDFFIDGFDNKPANSNYSVGESLVVSGWVTDTKKQDGVKNVYVIINNNTFIAKLGIERMDVAQYFNDQKLKNSGFESEIITNNFQSGENEILIKVQYNSGKEIVSSPWMYKLLKK